MKDLAPITSERLDHKLREELEDLEDQLAYEQRHGPVSGDPSVEAELVSTRQKRKRR